MSTFQFPFPGLNSPLCYVIIQQPFNGCVSTLKTRQEVLDYKLMCPESKARWKAVCDTIQCLSV